MYTMQRTQIYLSDEEIGRLDREAERTGKTRSRLIRDAINRAYAHQVDIAEFDRVLRESAGAWKGAPFTGQEYVEAIRSRGFSALEELWPEWYGADADIDR
jgi:predicted transcriptional regulator